MHTTLLWALFGCSTPFSSKVGEGVWKESDYTAQLNSGCPANGVFQNALNLTYEFGDDSRFRDTGYWSTPSINAIQSYEESLWEVCGSSIGNARFTCSIPTIFVHYDTWKENFPVEELHQEQGCDIQLIYGYTDGLFIDDKTIQVVNSFKVICTEDPEGYTALRTCEGIISSKWTKQ